MLDPGFAAVATACLTTSERAQLARIARVERRLQFVFGHWLGRGLLADVTARPLQEVAIEVTAEGRPLALGCGAPALSLAHSGPWVVALAASVEEGASVGIDIEFDDGGGSDAAWPLHRRHPRRRADVETAAWVLAEARAKAGPLQRAPAWQTRWQADGPPDGPATWHLAAANVEFSPRVHLVKVLDGSYNPRPFDLHWKQAHT